MLACSSRARRVLAVALALVFVLPLSGALVAAQSPSPALLKELSTGKLVECLDPSFPPMEYYENPNSKTPIGFDVDLVNEIGKRLGVPVTITPTEFTGMLPGLQSGRCDVVASGVYLTKQRLQTFDAQPYYDTSIVLMTLSKNDTIHSPEDLSGKTMAVEAGTNYINILNQLNDQLKKAGKPQMRIQTYPKQTDAIQQLIVGRADATITQDTEYAYREKVQAGQFKIAYTYPNPQTFAIYYRKGDTVLGSALKQAVEAMRADGTLAALAKKWNLPVKGTNYTTGTPAA